MTSLARRRSRIERILAWNTPLRVAERVALLDQLSNRRVIFGMGRGLSRKEYEQFGILDKLEHWRRVAGSFDMIVAVRAAGIPYSDAEHSLRLFAQKVIPELKGWSDRSAA